MNIDDVKVAILGLGYVGLPLAIEFSKVKTVVGFDINSSRIKELRQGRDSTLEVDAKSITQAANLYYSDDVSDLASCNVFIITD